MKKHPQASFANSRRLLDQIAQTLRHWDDGDLEVPLPTDPAHFHVLIHLLTSLNARLKRREQEISDLFHKPATGMVILNNEGAIRYANLAASRLLNQSAENLKGMSLGMPLVGNRTTEIEIRRGPNDSGVAEIAASPIEWEGEAAHLVIFHDITERKHAEETVRYQAYHDPLTGLPNRTQFQERVTESIRRVQKWGGGFALLFLDLDRFKDINDSLGHAAGDELLFNVARQLQEVVRDNDIVARMSGDEFTILLEQVRDQDAALTVAEKIRKRLTVPSDSSGSLVIPSDTRPAGVTIGISLYPEDGADAETLLMHADTAMYQGKKAGGNQCRAFAPEHAEITSRRFQLEQALKYAWANDGFRLAYQPQVALPGGDPIGLEALLRWENPASGLVLAGEFVPLLEEIGMIQDVGAWVFRQALADLRRWEAAGIPVGRIWINVAARQLADGNLLIALDRLVEEEDLPPGRFGIELTESDVAGDFSNALTLLEELRKRGFRIAMDDFGKGYSSLTFLYRLPLDLIKIDRSFIQTITTDGKGRGPRLVRAIIDLAHDLGLPIVAEGVEQQAQADWLGAQGCDFAQGFLFEHPLPANEIGLALQRLASPHGQDQAECT